MAAKKFDINTMPRPAFMTFQLIFAIIVSPIIAAAIAAFVIWYLSGATWWGYRAHSHPQDGYYTLIYVLFFLCFTSVFVSGISLLRSKVPVIDQFSTFRWRCVATFMSPIVIIVDLFNLAVFHQISPTFDKKKQKK